MERIRRMRYKLFFQHSLYLSIRRHTTVPCFPVFLSPHRFFERCQVYQFVLQLRYVPLNLSSCVGDEGVLCNKGDVRSALISWILILNQARICPGLLFYCML